MFRKIEDMTWPAPCDALDEVQWTLRFAKPTRSDLLIAAGVMAAYNQMISDSKKKRDMIIRELRSGPNLPHNDAVEKPHSAPPKPLQPNYFQPGARSDAKCSISSFPSFFSPFFVNTALNQASSAVFLLFSTHPA